MIREDYLIGWIKRFVRFLTEIAGLMKADQYQAALQQIDLALRELLGLGADSISSLSEGEILARLTLGETTQLVQEKFYMLAALLRQLGLALAAQNRVSESQDSFLRSLHIMLGARLRDDQVPLPEYAPRIEDLVDLLKSGNMSLRTRATLMLYYEQTGQCAKAEDALFIMLEEVPGNADLIDIGLAFYDRLLQLDDAMLVAGNLPRSEAEAGLRELKTHRPNPSTRKD
jgi:hypothetical protein